MLHYILYPPVQLVLPVQLVWLAVLDHLCDDHDGNNPQVFALGLNPPNKGM